MERIQIIVKGKNIVLRAALAFGLAVLGFMLLAGSSAEASPFQPSPEQLLKSQPQSIQFAPARAGWNGPMMETQKAMPASATDFNLMLDQAALARATRKELQQIAIPDPRMLAALVGLIFLLRKWRELRPAPQPSPMPA